MVSPGFSTETLLLGSEFATVDLRNWPRDANEQVLEGWAAAHGDTLSRELRNNGAATVTFADPAYAAHAAAAETFRLRGQAVTVTPAQPAVAKGHGAETSKLQDQVINVQDNKLVLRWGVGRRDSGHVGIVYHHAYNRDVACRKVDMSCLNLDELMEDGNFVIPTRDMHTLRQLARVSPDGRNANRLWLRNVPSTVPREAIVAIMSALGEGPVKQVMLAYEGPGSLHQVLLNPAAIVFLPPSARDCTAEDFRADLENHFLEGFDAKLLPQEFQPPCADRKWEASAKIEFATAEVPNSSNLLHLHSLWNNTKEVSSE